MDREGMREAGPTSADAALVEAARGAPAAFFQFRISPSGAFSLPFVSPAFAARYGFEQGEPEETATRFFSRIHPDDLRPMRKAIARSARTLETFESEFRFRLPSGAEVWAEARAKPERTAGGGILWNGIVADITARMDAESALRGSEAQFRAMFESAPVGVAQADPKTGRWVKVNPKLCEITGYSARELLTRRFSEVTHPDDRERDWAVFERTLSAGGREYAVEKRYVRKDGSIAWVDVHVTIVRDATGAPTHSIGIIEDITERKEAVEAVAASEARYRALFENAAEGIAAVDPASKQFQFFNPALCAMFGYTPGEFGSLTVADIHPKEALEGVRAAFQKLESGTSLLSPAIPCLKKDGTVFVADIRASELEVAGRKVVYGFFTDVTARMHLEERLRQAHKMEAVGQLAGGVAHDFNNLLTVISGNCDLLLAGASADAPARGPLEDIHAAAERAANLTRQLLAYSRKQILEPKLVDVHEVVAGVEKMLRRLIGEDIDFSTDLTADPSWVRADPGQLEQVVVNLAVNARDAMPRGGRITIRTRNAAPAECGGLEETAGRQKRPCVAISISDTGAGIPPEVKAHLFEPFFTTKGAGKGTGLGLATVFGIVKQSGGDIAVESEPGKGATFTVLLPSRPAPRQRGGSGASPREAPRGTETVLAVEDEAAVRRIVKITLQSAGYQVIEAQSGPEALEAASQHAGKIHLVVTDIVMPGMSGRELAERFVKDQPGVRFLFISGYTDDAIMRHGIVESSVAFLQKPFTPLALARKVREVLDAKAV